VSQPLQRRKSRSVEKPVAKNEDVLKTKVIGGKKGEGRRVSGTCEKIGFTDFSTTHFQ
jgi:hypothetical protein